MTLTKNQKKEIVDKLKDSGIILGKEVCELTIKISEGNICWIRKEITIK